MTVAAVYVRAPGQKRWRLHSVAERLDEATMVAETIQAQRRSRGVDTLVVQREERAAVKAELSGR